MFCQVEIIQPVLYFVIIDEKILGGDEGWSNTHCESCDKDVVDVTGMSKKKPSNSLRFYGKFEMI